MYPRDSFIKDCLAVFRETEGNTAEIPGTGTVTFFDEPLIGFAAADDGLFETFRQPEIVGPNYFAPEQWLPGAGTVVSFFLPFTEQVRSANRSDRMDPAPEWLYGRMEGQAFIGRFAAGIRQLLEEKGIGACVPAQDGRFGVRYEMTLRDGTSDIHVDSRWSERHAAYACGLGTFGLSRGLITEKGMAGRFASVIAAERWPADPRPYTGIDDYCVRCGACVRNCPVGAITLKDGKNNILCKVHSDRMKAKYAPRYGCGKCQVGVPCECRVPGRKD